MYPGPQLIGSTSIRLLTLFPDEDDAPLRCRLEVANLTENPAFVALSYVWGVTAQPPQVVLCNGHPFEVTENCWEALAQFRQDIRRSRNTSAEPSSIALWIDAICINQKDEVEKTGQIMMMGEIYKKASSVCIWLGKADSETDEAMDYLENCGFQDLLDPSENHSYTIPQKAHSRAMLRILFLRFIEILSFAVWPRNAYKKNRASMCLPDQLVSDYAVPVLLGRQWITRVWTLQEAVLNPNPYIQCGSKRLPWRSLIHSVAFISRFGWFNEAAHRWIALVKMWNEIHIDPNDAKTLDESRKQFFRRAKPESRTSWMMPIFVTFILEFVGLFLTLFAKSSIVLYVFSATCGLYLALFLLAMVNCNLLRWERGYNTSLHPGTILNPLRAIVQEIRRRRCLEPIDRIRGAVEVLNQLGINIGGPVSTDNFAAISTELTVKCLEGCKSLNLLLCCSNQGPKGQPSWVPNWDLSGEDSWLDPKYLSFTPMDLRSARYSVTAELHDPHTWEH
ncbi:heterokaryon incompatibility protein-domain-containing protein [Hypoxylon trugodes]|uniref:heterokaryon incompatibility protein-domain-containing protein n=1 Tax=Hypoxylon trugodes TaxID=326681 RepID=UPI00219DB473|nr:heterokaryon incompatibility protein-domain-containing protein [Hypoxylon trugodes]KAI1392829.1 heterokaryon incompatibility protein-domain-containing protein [Hypoxylon trugodes]